MKAGKAHGAQPEDIYGCLYFLLSDELTAFHQRIRKFPITFRMFDLEATKLADAIQADLLSDVGLPASTRFDRIEVSNILDFNYIGMEKTLTHISPLLSHTSHATIVGYFMNWFIQQKDGRAGQAGGAVMRRATERTIARMKVKYSFQHIVRAVADIYWLSVGL